MEIRVDGKSKREWMTEGKCICSDCRQVLPLEQMSKPQTGKLPKRCKKCTVKSVRKSQRAREIEEAKKTGLPLYSGPVNEKLDQIVAQALQDKEFISPY